MNRNEIAETLRQWITEGKMFSSAMLNKSGMSTHEVGRKCASGELFRSRHGAVIFTEDALRNQFDDWLYSENKCIYTGADLGAMRGLVKLYDINKACANGEYLRFDALGKSATLYIE